MSTRRLLAGSVAAVTLLSSGAAVAEVASMPFGHARTGPQDRVVTVCDDQADGHSVYSHYYRTNSGQQRVENYKGKGTCKDSHYSTYRVVQFNVCRNVSYQPDKCSGWSYVG